MYTNIFDALRIVHLHQYCFSFGMNVKVPLMYGTTVVRRYGRLPYYYQLQSLA